MRKKIFLMIILGQGLLCFKTYASDWDYGAQLRLRNDNKQLDHSTSDAPGTTQLRARLMFDAKVNDKTKFHIAPQATKYYGQAISPTSSADTGTNVHSSGDKYHSNMDLFESYVEVHRSNMGYKLGRQTLDYGENVILGNRNWTAGGLAFDAFKFMFNLGESELNLVHSTISEGSNRNEPEDDAILTFLYYKMLQKKDLQFDLYVINHDDRTNDDRSVSYGFRLKGKLGGFDYRTENIVQNDVTNDKVEHNVNLELGQYFSDSVRAHIGFAQASENYNQLYTNRHLYNGVIDIVGRKNLNTYEVGLDYVANTDLSFKLQYMSFAQKQKGVGAYELTTATVLTGDASKEQIGNEIDMFATYHISQNEQLTLSYSQFQYGDYFVNDEDKSNFIYLEYLFQI